jgi:hypothetical protein
VGVASRRRTRNENHRSDQDSRTTELCRIRLWRRLRLGADVDPSLDLFGATEGTTVLTQAKNKDPRRLLATIVTLGALAAVPMVAVAPPAAAAPVSGIVQVDKNWQHPRGGDDEDQDEQDENELGPFGGLFGQSNPFGDLLGGLFGGSNPFGGQFGGTNPFGGQFGGTNPFGGLFGSS